NWSDIYGTLSDVGIRVEGVEEAIGRVARQEVYSTERIAVGSTGIVDQEERREHAVVY
ncbi:hypothetical protein A2U01_0118480, partial [Trifolium medium]|nr:hypothetical protein [Trifolium medium]